MKSQRDRDAELDDAESEAIIDRMAKRKGWDTREDWIRELADLCQEDIFTDAIEYRQRVGRAFDLATAIKGGPAPEVQS